MPSPKIHYQPEANNGLFANLYREALPIIKKNEQYPQTAVFLKSVVFITLYLGMFVMIFFTGNIVVLLSAYALMGICTTFIVLNIVHEAAHGTLFRQKKLNNLAIGLLEIFGTDSYLWKKRHVSSHHAYPNIFGYDADIVQAGALRIHPATPYLSAFRYQPYYAFVLYFFFTLNWFFIRDFRDAFVDHKLWKVSRFRAIKIALQKAVVMLYMIVLPAFFSSITPAYFFFGYLIMHFATSITAILALGTAHVNDDSEFPSPDEVGLMPDSWAIHQIKVTQDFATNNCIVDFLFGGFNYHTAHHLFPGVHHRCYPEITELIKNLAPQYGVHYKSKPLHKALWSHYKLIVNNASIEVDL